MLPDGRRVTYGPRGYSYGPTSSINLGSRVHPYMHSSNSALTNSFMSADKAAQYPPGERYGHQHQLGRQPSLENGLPTIDTTYTSSTPPAFGSPRDDETGKLALARSPVNNVHSVLDAPLPASFDSNDISRAARYGPFPASVPSKFGLESPSPSLHSTKEDRPSETLKLLHTSAFGSSERLSPSNLVSNDNLMGSSPTLNAAEDYMVRRSMHSSSSRHSKQGISSSVPNGHWDPNFTFEEDLLPEVLANDVLTPQEKARRGSLRMSEADALSELPPASMTKFGSPVTSASPSRWGSLFQRQREEEMESGSLAKAMKHTGSSFGHVGSPLRNSSLAIDGELRAGNSIRPSSGGRSASDSLSVLTQQLQRTRLGDDGSGGSSPHLHPQAARLPSGSTATPGFVGRERDRERGGLERHVSSSSVGSNRYPTPIDEEDPAFVFRMEEEDEQSHRSLKRKSGGLGVGSWSYAGIVAGKSTTNTAKGRESTGIAETVGGGR